jgi:hypothetical protein
MHTAGVRLVLTFAVGMAALLTAGDLKFSDPARQFPAPPAAAGYPSRAPDLDALPGFRNPPPGYGEVPFYWWLGDPLTKERLSWRLAQLKGKGVTALQVNYAHSDRGGLSHGLTYPSNPPLFSKPWWDLFGWFLKQARQQGMAVSLSDYTLGWPGQGWYIDEILKETPQVHGAVLDDTVHDCTGPNTCDWQLPTAPVSVMAYDTSSAVDLRPFITGRTLHWQVPQGHWRVVAVHAVDKPLSLDPMHPLSGRQIIAKFFQRFEDHNPGESGRGLNFFFSDELSFGVRGWLWDARFADEFRKRKGYDIIPELPALFTDVGPRTPKVRLDYSDVMVSLEEENYFRPVYEWHRSRGMMYGCDHGGRGRDVTEFGDYFRTQRWMVAPGCDQPGLRSEVIKNKVASSITHLYGRQRTWLEGYYGSGWGTTSADVVDATWRNFVMGQNLLTLHGLYYSTHGGWWEWAPPCNHDHMPYWAHMGEFLHASERLSYLLSQGHHRADVAILYPVAAMEAGLGGKESVRAAFDLGTHLYEQGIDFDFMDFESLARASVEERQLKVSGEAYRVLVLPAMRAVRESTLRKALEFHRAGGIVVILGAAPEASERVGRDDTTLRNEVRELSAHSVRTPAEVETIVNNAFPRDFLCASAKPQVLHRRVGPRDVYMVYGVPKDTVCSFRAVGNVELWNPWNGQVSPLRVTRQSGGLTTLGMPLEETEAQLIVFSPGKPAIFTRQPPAPVETISLAGAWEFELKPTLDNRWGDYRLPATNAMIGAEARRFRYAEETAPDPGWQSPSLDDSAWRTVTSSYGPRFWKLGPLPADQSLDTAAPIDPAAPVAIAGHEYRWQPYEFSLRWGVEGDAGHQGYHGLKGIISDDFIALGAPRYRSTTTVYDAESAGPRYYLWTTVAAPRAMSARLAVGGDPPAAVWINGAPLPSGAATVHLNAGANPVLLRYDHPGRGHFALEDAAAPPDWKQTYPLSSRWYNHPGVLPFDIQPRAARPVGWYRFTAPPGLRSMTIVVRGKLQTWADGTPVRVERRADGRYLATLAHPASAPVQIALRVEQERGWYGGAALPEPVALDCAPGPLPAGDWSRIDGLASYSGSAWYRKTVTLTAAQARAAVLLNLGQVAASAEVHVNGHTAGVKVAPPWKLDISRSVHPGENRIEILVYNTLANHYQTVPTRYRGSPVSGLLGPVSLELRKE